MKRTWPRIQKTLFIIIIRKQDFHLFVWFFLLLLSSVSSSMNSESRLVFLSLSACSSRSCLAVIPIILLVIAPVSFHSRAHRCWSCTSCVRFFSKKILEKYTFILVGICQTRNDRWKTSTKDIYR